MSRWTCEHCGHKNSPHFGNCGKCLHGFDEDFLEPNWPHGKFVESSRTTRETEK